MQLFCHVQYIYFSILLSCCVYFVRTKVMKTIHFFGLLQYCTVYYTEEAVDLNFWSTSICTRCSRFYFIKNRHTASVSFGNSKIYDISEPYEYTSDCRLQRYLHKLAFWRSDIVLKVIYCFEGQILFWRSDIVLKVRYCFARNRFYWYQYNLKCCSYSINEN